MSVSVSYIPDGKVLGLSKIARICDMCAKRLQLQERLTSDIVECIQLATGSKDVAVRITGNHSCMTARGIRNTNSYTETIIAKGKYETDKNLINLVY